MARWRNSPRRCRAACWREGFEQVIFRLLLLVLLMSPVAMAQAQPLLLWEDPLTEEPLAMDTAGSDLLLRFKGEARRLSFEGAAVETLTFSAAAEGETSGGFFARSTSGQLALMLNAREGKLTLTTPLSGSRALPLPTGQGFFNRAVVGAAGKTALLYPQKSLGPAERAVVLWLDATGEPLLRYVHDRPVENPTAVLSGNEHFAAFTDADRLLVLSRQGLLRDIRQTSGQRGWVSPQLLLSGELRAVVVLSGGDAPFAEGWRLDARPLYRVNLPSAMTWSYTEGAPVAVGLPPQGGPPLLLNVLSGELKELPGVGEDLLFAQTDETGAMLATVDRRALRLWLVSE